MAKNDVRVMPDGKEWEVKTDGKSCASKKFKKQSSAESYAKKQAKKNKGELFVHDRENKIRKRNSYGSDPEHREG
jgi:hypothetical protein